MWYCDISASWLLKSTTCTTSPVVMHGWGAMACVCSDESGAPTPSRTHAPEGRGNGLASTAGGRKRVRPCAWVVRQVRTHCTSGKSAQRRRAAAHPPSAPAPPRCLAGRARCVKGWPRRHAAGRSAARRDRQRRTRHRVERTVSKLSKASTALPLVRVSRSLRSLRTWDDMRM